MGMSKNPLVQDGAKINRFSYGRIFLFCPCFCHIDLYNTIGYQPKFCLIKRLYCARFLGVGKGKK